MTEGLHEISQAIGRLQNEAESSTRQRTLIFEKLDEIKDALTPLVGLPEHVTRHCADLKTLNDHVQKGRGAIWAVKALWGVVIVLIPAGYWLINEYKKDQDFRLYRIERQLPKAFP